MVNYANEDISDFSRLLSPENVHCDECSDSRTSGALIPKFSVLAWTNAFHCDVRDVVDITLTAAHERLRLLTHLTVSCEVFFIV